MPDPPPAYRVPDAPSVDGLEARWGERWDAEGVYRFNREATKATIYAIDTPPPTVSGSLHLGHVFSYTHGDLMARYFRMRGRDVFYPVGWDDNGLPTERRVQNYYGVRCDPTLPYDPDFEPDEPAGEARTPVSRRNFVELCTRLTAIDEEAFKGLWRFLGLSVDWSLEYSTISPHARAISQRAFLEMLERDEVYASVAPTLWDVDFQTAVSQAELEDRERPGVYHRVAFARVGAEGTIEIETTRPELLASCVALVCHPEDPRYAGLVNTTVRTPLFGVEVPIVAHELADPQKGSGIAMVCTFGDTTDVTWWRDLDLATRALIGRDGRFAPCDFADPAYASVDPAAANAHYGELVGRSVTRARAIVVEKLREAGALVGEPREITHPVKFYEKGERPLEIVTSRQWFVRTLENREALLARGEELAWHPDFMRHRYRSWVEGLNVDWNISRQRFFGVPFPLWYPIDESGEVDVDHPLRPTLADLPVDPSSDAPPGYAEAQRGQPGGFVGDPDVMDTWATSSLSPQIAGHWGTELFERLFPFDLRLQAHEIIRTWLFSTVVRAHLGHDSLPFTNVLVSGWVLDPERKKMSKSKGNAVTPLPLLERHGADAVRYWAALGRPGTDTAVDEGQMKVGRRLALQILNASKFVLGRIEPGVDYHAHEVTAPLDRDLLAQLDALILEATGLFERYDYARVLERVEAFFWGFCDDYLELVKLRAYGEGTESEVTSARATLALALSSLQRLFAPFLPYVTEEVWRWWREGSIHVAPWPEPLAVAAVEPTYDAVRAVLEAVRREKSTARVSQRARVAALSVSGPAETIEALKRAEADLRGAGSIEAIEYAEGPELAVAVELAVSS
ncbi:MAG: valine--tRNA ligase [Acidimicrobiales bacterium]